MSLRGESAPAGGKLVSRLRDKAAGWKKEGQANRERSTRGGVRNRRRCLSSQALFRRLWAVLAVSWRPSSRRLLREAGCGVGRFLMDGRYDSTLGQQQRLLSTGPRRFGHSHHPRSNGRLFPRSSRPVLWFKLDVEVRLRPSSRMRCLALRRVTNVRPHGNAQGKHSSRGTKWIQAWG